MPKTGKIDALPWPSLQ